MKIQLKDYGSCLVSRDLAKKIVSSIANNNERMDLDFNGVETVTPSFSHELLSDILDKNSSIKEVELLNTNQSVKLQLKKALLSIKEDKREAGKL